MKRRKKFIVGVIVIAALIILPTFTPEDIPTTWMIVALGGWKFYFWLTVSILALLWAFEINIFGRKK